MLSPRIIYSIVLISLSSVISNAQENGYLTLHQCIDLALEKYPLSKQRELISQVSDLKTNNIQQEYLPKINIRGQATLQSEVPEIPIELPESDISTLDKDQYKIFTEIDQLIFDGGRIKEQKKLEEIDYKVRDYELDMNLHHVKRKVCKLFFSILIIKEQITLNKLLAEDVELGLERIKVAIENGTALKSEGFRLTLGLMNIQQRTIELETFHDTYINMLSVYLGSPLDSIELVKPALPNNTPQLISRSQLNYFNQKIKKYESMNRLIDTKVIPQLSFFAQAGYGRPALNFLSNEFSSYYIAGIKLKWAISEFYASGKEKKINKIHQQQIALEKESFLFDTQREIEEQNGAIVQYQKQLETDDEIITMHQYIKKVSLNKLTNGVIEAHDYLRDINEENQALLNKSIREINLLKLHFEKEITIGNL